MGILLFGAALLGAMLPATSPHKSAAPAPALQPRMGSAFRPVQGDWEGVVGGFPASFRLGLNRMARGSAAAPGYSVTDLVVLTPQTCPPSPARYRESFLGETPARVAGNGYFPLGATHVSGGLDGAGAANLSTSYSVGSCHGTLTWRMHPATRVAVSDGRWTAHFSPGGSESFAVRGDGRLATAITLPASLTACNGTRGGVDLFIGPSGRARTVQGTMTLALRFDGRRARGSITARGCAPIAVTASRHRA